MELLEFGAQTMDTTMSKLPGYFLTQVNQTQPLQMGYNSILFKQILPSDSFYIVRVVIWPVYFQNIDGFNVLKYLR